MSKTAKWVIAILVVILVIAGGWYFGTKPTVPAETGSIKIGVSAPLTGDASLWGIESKNGLELALSKLDPKIKDRIQLVVEDSKCDAKTGVDVANKLVNVDKVKYITGEICSSVVLATLPITESNKILMMSPGASSPAITGAGKYFFRTWPSDNYEGGVLADFAKNKLNLSKIAIFSINNDYGVGLRDVFKDKFESIGGQIVAMESFDPSDKDFKTQLAKIKAANPEAIYLDSNPEQMPLVLKQIREMKLVQKLLANGPSTDGNTAIAKAGKNLADGVLYASPAWKNPDSFLSDYKAMFNKEPGIAADTSYDAFNLLIKAVEKCGNDTGCARDELAKTKDYKGAAGNTTFDSKGDVIGKNFMLKVVKGELFVPYE